MIEFSYIFEEISTKKSLLLTLYTMWCILEIDECAENGLNNCTENATCANTPGSYNCYCYAGYTGNPYSSCSG